MTAFQIAVVVLALIGITWIVWDLRWRGVYIVAMIGVATLIARWSTSAGVNPIAPVFAFILAATVLGYRVFGSAIRKKR